MLFRIPILSQLKALKVPEGVSNTLQELQPEYLGTKPKVYLPKRKQEY
jgi:hypothetical protein